MLQAVLNFWCRWRTAENRWFDFLRQPRITSHITWKYWYLINNKLNLFPVLVDTKHFATENALFFTTRKETIVEVFIFSYLKIIKKIMLVLNALFFGWSTNIGVYTAFSSLFFAPSSRSFSTFLYPPLESPLQAIMSSMSWKQMRNRKCCHGRLFAASEKLKNTTAFW